MLYFFFFKQKTAYEMRISDWSSDVCSSDLRRRDRLHRARAGLPVADHGARDELRPKGPRQPGSLTVPPTSDQRALATALAALDDARLAGLLAARGAPASAGWPDLFHVAAPLLEPPSEPGRASGWVRRGQ